MRPQREIREEQRSWERQACGLETQRKIGLDTLDLIPLVHGHGQKKSGRGLLSRKCWLTLCLLQM